MNSTQISPQASTVPAAPKPIKRHRLTAEEKATVVKLYEELGVGCWDKVQEVLHLKSKRTAREHFYKFLITDSKKPFTPEEDALIIEKVNELGTKWSHIAKFFKNRSDINIRNRYRILSRNKDKPRKSKPKVRLQEPCPQLHFACPQSNVAEIPEIKPGENIIILDYHHFDIINVKDINSANLDDYYGPNCFKM